MNWCCGSRNEKSRINEFKNLSDRNLKLKLKTEKRKCLRECWFGSLYAVTALGSGIATGLSGGASSIAGTIPTTILASVATYDSFNHMHESQQNSNVIQDIITERKKVEIIYLDNKNAITICNKNEPFN